MRIPYLPPEQWLAVVSAALMVVSAGTLLALRWFDRQVTEAVTWGSVSS